MSASTKKLSILIGGLAVFTAVLVFGVNLWFKRLSPEESKPAATLPPVEKKSEINPWDSGAVKIATPDTINDERPIFYGSEGFQPKEVTIKIKDKIVGCLITVKNISSKAIKVGLSPHLESGDRGVSYTELAPNETGIYDVRYNGFTEVKLHNHYKPEHEMRVIYGRGCSL
jgi:hypothetical protein